MHGHYPLSWVNPGDSVTDPAGAKTIINEQSVSIKSKIKEKCSSNLHMPSRKLTEEMLKNEDKLCKQGAPTLSKLFLN